MSNKAVFSWSRGLNGPAITFEVRYKIGQGSFKTDTTKDTIYEIDNLKSNTKVKFEVRSVGVAPQNKVSNYTTINITIPKASQPSSTSPVTPTVLLPPDPENVSVEATTKNEAIVKWNTNFTYAGNRQELVATIRHSSETDGSGLWPNTTFIREVSALTSYLILPLMNGEYLVKFRDKEGNKSENAGSAVINLPDELPKLLVQTVREDQGIAPFPGQRNDCFYSDEYDALVLNTDDEIDDKKDFEQGYLQNIDFGGTLKTSGQYFFQNIVDLGGIFTVQFNRILKIRGLYPNDTIDLHTTNIDQWSDFDGALPDETNGVLKFRKSNSAITIDQMKDENEEFVLLEDGSKLTQQSTSVFGDFVPLENGRYTGRVFQFGLDLTSEYNDQTPLVDELGYQLLFENRTESNSMSSGTGAKVVTFDKAFYQTPKLGITAINMVSGDYYVISSESRTGFTITFFNNSDSPIDRTFSYQANGFGAEGA
tara:strand:- start:3947 stop:5389 length:1443 start_codon:yes stop_codon:yes gene_type:complete